MPWPAPDRDAQMDRAARWETRLDDPLLVCQSQRYFRSSCERSDSRANQHSLSGWFGCQRSARPTDSACSARQLLTEADTNCAKRFGWPPSAFALSPTLTHNRLGIRNQSVILAESWPTLDAESRSREARRVPLQKFSCTLVRRTTTGSTRAPCNSQNQKVPGGGIEPPTCGL